MGGRDGVSERKKNSKKARRSLLAPVGTWLHAWNALVAPFLCCCFCHFSADVCVRCCCCCGCLFLFAVASQVRVHAKALQAAARVRRDARWRLGRRSKRTAHLARRHRKRCEPRPCGTFFKKDIWNASKYRKGRRLRPLLLPRCLFLRGRSVGCSLKSIACPTYL